MDVNAGGGVAPYTGTVINNVPASNSTYPYTIHAANQCSATATIIITEPALVTATASATAIACFGNSVTVTVNAGGGVAPYTGTVINNVPASNSTYTYTIHDANQCSATATINITEPALLTATASAPAIACFGNSVTVTVNTGGGVAPYTGTVINNVPASNSTYTYTIHDANQCSATATINITQPTPFIASATSTQTYVCFGASTNVTITATGGTPAYTGTVINNVIAGAHSYTVINGNNCPATVSIQISQPAAPLTAT